MPKHLGYHSINEEVDSTAVAGVEEGITVVADVVTAEVEVVAAAEVDTTASRTMMGINSEMAATNNSVVGIAVVIEEAAIMAEEEVTEIRRTQANPEVTIQGGIG